VVVTKGKFGPYIKYGDLNVTLPRKADPLTVSLKDCIALIDAQKNGTAQQAELVSFPEADIVVLEGRYGPYIKHAGKNFRIPKGKNPRRLTLDDCRLIISGSATKASGSRFRRFKKQ
jgi:DNA topoisomerase-1